MIDCGWFPREARTLPDTWHRCYNLTAGTSEDRPFGDAEKELLN